MEYTEGPWKNKPRNSRTCWYRYLLPQCICKIILCIYLFLIWNVPLLYFNLLMSIQYLHVKFVKLEVRKLYLLHMKLNSQNVLDMFDLTWPIEEWNNVVIAMRGLTYPTKKHFTPPHTLKPGSLILSLRITPFTFLFSLLFHKGWELLLPWTFEFVGSTDILWRIPCFSPISNRITTLFILKTPFFPLFRRWGETSKATSLAQQQRQHATQRTGGKFLWDDWRVPWWISYVVSRGGYILE